LLYPYIDHTNCERSHICDGYGFVAAIRPVEVLRKLLAFRRTAMVCMSLKECLPMWRVATKKGALFVFVIFCPEEIPFSRGW